MAERPVTLVDKKRMSFQFDLGRTVTVSQDWWEEHGAFRSHPAGQEPSPGQSKVVEPAELGGSGSSTGHMETMGNGSQREGA